MTRLLLTSVFKGRDPRPILLVLPIEERVHVRWLHKHLKPVRVGVGEPILVNVTLISLKFRRFILTLNTLNTTDDTSQVNSFPFLDLFFGLNFKSRVESSAAISWLSLPGLRSR